MKTLAKLPVTIVTGFLGSGKTTLLRHMLDNAQGRRIAVIVNEFGELGIDGEILKQCSIGCTEEEATGRVYELANGCLCCTVQEEFFPVMRELVARRGDLDHILIETSGLALPKTAGASLPVARNPQCLHRRRGDHCGRQPCRWPPAPSPPTRDQVDAQRKLDPNLDHESPLHELFADQLASADLVVLNKADLIDAEGLAKVRAEVAEELPPAVKVVEASSGKLPLEVLLGVGAESEAHIDGRRTHHDSHHDGDDHDDHDHDAFDSISIDLPEADESLLLDALTQLVVEFGILRAKGFAAIPGKPMRLLVQGVGTRFDKHFDRAWRADEPRITRLVLIGQDLDAAQLEARLRQALGA
ncbi:cobalamin biosynthesis protein CobW [Pseudomonas putida S11]|nr:cobalamin biosynthesis protein CobW [Pseudomonas putida S11]